MLLRSEGALANINMIKQWIVNQCGCSLANASQACNDILKHPGDVESVDDRPTGYTKMQCTVGKALRRVYHASAGSESGKTCTIFFVEYPKNMCHIVALGKHTGPSSYNIVYMKACWTYGNNVTL